MASAEIYYVDFENRKLLDPEQLTAAEIQVMHNARVKGRTALNALREHPNLELLPELPPPTVDEVVKLKLAALHARLKSRPGHKKSEKKAITLTERANHVFSIAAPDVQETAALRLQELTDPNYLNKLEKEQS